MGPTAIVAAKPSPWARIFFRPDDPSGRVRPEIQALRAAAVTAVVIFHIWPGVLTGGYVGVDVFFAISGYLIIGHLLRESDATGRVRLVDFWARRARRLIPASLATLVVTTIAVLIWVPRVFWAQFIQEIGAAAVYVVNWVLAANAVDYLGSQNTPSPVQHFWSLSVEEQFYIAWPILIVLTILIARKWEAPARRRLLVGLLVVVVVASAAYSILETRQSPAAAYFSTGTRAWEFGVGGILAAFSARIAQLPEWAKAGAGWLGAILIAVAAVHFSSVTAFPGYRAWLPVIGSLLVIAGGLPRVAWSLAFVFRLRPVQWLGDISYSVYLWHWPIIVIAPFVLGGATSSLVKVGLILLALILGWASKRFVEDPLRVPGRRLGRSPWFAVTATIVATGLIFGASVGWVSSINDSVAQAREKTLALINSNAPCIGAAAYGPGRACPHPFAVTSATDPVAAAQDIGLGVQVVDKCKQTGEDAAVLTCTIGDTSHPTHHLALVGDSHAGVYLEPLQSYGEKHGWEITTYLKTWCIGTGADRVAAPDNLDASGVASCSQWGQSVLGKIAADPTIDTVVFSNFTAKYDQTGLGSLGRRVTPDDFTAAWSRLRAAGKSVVVLRDLPNAGDVAAPGCIAEHYGVEDPCSTPRAVAIPAHDPQWDAVQSDPQISGVDLSDNFCDATTCHTLIGGLIVYFDTHHLTASFARTLAPYLGSAIDAAMNRVS